jgi:hypothetical protein
MPDLPFQERHISPVTTIVEAIPFFLRRGGPNWLDRAFTRTRAVARHRAGPLFEEQIHHLTDLAEYGMRRIELQIRAHDVLEIAKMLRAADRSCEVTSCAEIGQKARRRAQCSKRNGNSLRLLRFPSSGSRRRENILTFQR